MMKKDDLTTRTIIDSICVGLMWSIGGPIMALLYCLGIAAEDRRKEEEKQIEELNEIVKTSRENRNAGNTYTNQGEDVNNFLKEFGHLI